MTPNVRARISYSRPGANDVGGRDYDSLGRLSASMLAALALTEALTRIADRPEPVPDAIWEAAAEHFDETQLGALVLDIGTINLWNRLNVATQQQVVGEQGG